MGRSKRRNKWNKKTNKKIFPIFNKGDKDMMQNLQKIQDDARKAAQELTVGRTNGMAPGTKGPQGRGVGTVGRTTSGYNTRFPMGFQPGTPVEECWESGITVLKSCGSAPEKAKVTINPLAMAKINALMAHYPKIEWLAYLIGEGSNITDIVIPEQEVTTVRVDVAPEGVDVPTIGVIHSHHDMGNGFSHTDDTYINLNHPMSLCISHDGINGVVKVKTACNKYVLVKAEVFVRTEGFNHSEFIKEAEKQITKKTYTPQPYVHPNYMHVGHPGVNKNVPVNNHLGAEGTGNFPEVGFGIVDLATTVRKDIKDVPEEFDLMDLVGLKEIIAEVIRPDRNVEVFTALYQNLLDSNKFQGDDELMFCAPIELLDEIDGSLDDMTNQEHVALITLLKGLIDAINIIQEDMIALDIMANEVSDEDIEVTGTSVDSLPSDEDIWTVDDEAEGLEALDTDTKEVTASNGMWSTPHQA